MSATPVSQTTAYNSTTLQGRQPNPSKASMPVGNSMDSVGVHVHFFNPENSQPLVSDRDLDRIQQAGFRRVRMDILWSQLEKQPGVYDFSRYDWAIQGLLKRGIRPIVILGVGNPLYNKEASLQPASTKAAYECYAQETVKHFKGEGLLYELINEPNLALFWRPTPNPLEYMGMLKELLPRLKAMDPSARFVAPSTAGAPMDYLESCFRQGLLNDIDGVTIHPYQTFYKTPPTVRMPEAFEKEYKQTRGLIDRYAPPGKKIPILLGEWGYSSVPTEVDEQTQARYHVRQALLGMLYGSPVNIWYDWKRDINGSSKLLEKEDNFGLVSNTLPEIPKPSYYAMQAMSRALAGQAFIRRLPSNPADYLLQFGNGQKTTIAAWTINPAHSVDIQGQNVMITGKPAFLQRVA